MYAFFLAPDMCLMLPLWRLQGGAAAGGAAAGDDAMVNMMKMSEMLYREVTNKRLLEVKVQVSVLGFV